jgi:hypothetical protein
LSVLYDKSSVDNREYTDIGQLRKEKWSEWEQDQNKIRLHNWRQKGKDEGNTTEWVRFRVGGMIHRYDILGKRNLYDAQRIPVRCGGKFRENKNKNK